MKRKKEKSFWHAIKSRDLIKVNNILTSATITEKYQLLCSLPNYSSNFTKYNPVTYAIVNTDYALLSILLDNLKLTYDTYILDDALQTAIGMSFRNDNMNDIVDCILTHHPHSWNPWNSHRGIYPEFLTIFSIYSSQHYETQVSMIEMLIYHMNPHSQKYADTQYKFIMMHDHYQRNKMQEHAQWNNYIAKMMAMRYFLPRKQCIFLLFI